MEEIKNRRSIRKYKSDPVSSDQILQLIESARLAPSGSNTQPWKFIVISKSEIKKKIMEADHDQTWMLSAPTFIVCVADIGVRIEKSEALNLDEESASPELKQIIRDTAIAIEHILLEAEKLGLGTCWTGWYDQKEMKELLGIPSDKYVCGIITVGFPDERPQTRPRKAMEEILCYEKWSF